MLIKVVKDANPVIKLARVRETDSRRTWIFTFADPRHKFMQSVIVMKDIPDVAFAVEDAYEKIWVVWSQKIKENSWRTGKYETVDIS